MNFIQNWLQDRQRTSKILLIMRLTAILIIACLQVSAGSSAQNNITLSVKNAPLEKVFRDIEKQSGYIVWCEKELLTHTSNVSIEIVNATLKEALTYCLQNQPLQFSIIGRTIVISLKEKNIVKSETTLIDISGSVQNEKGEPLFGASIQIKGADRGTTTAGDGSFSIRQVSAESKLVISYTGYINKEISVAQNDFISITLSAATNPLDEVQIIAYGTSTQRLSVGSISKISSREISSQVISNPLEALEGRVPGLVVNQTSGLPGSTVNIQIRGQNSIAPKATSVIPLDNPLFIINGVPFAPQNVNINQTRSLAAPGANGLYGNPYGGLSPFNSINPSDIESIEVLRDADATAIYGSRGANGVILITTKRGKSGKTELNGSVLTGESRITRSMPMMNTQQYLGMRREAINNDGLSTYLTPQFASFFPDLLVYDTTMYTNWEKYFLGSPAHVTDANGTISGGKENTQFLIGSGYHHESYIYPGNYADDKVSFNTNIHHNSIDKKLSIDFTNVYYYDHNNSSGSPAVLTAFVLPPNYPPLFGQNGSLNWSYKGVDLGTNPAAYLKQLYSLQQYNLISNLQVGYQVVKNLFIRSSFGYNTVNTKEYSNAPLASLDPASNPTSSAFFGSNNFQSWIIEPQAEFKRRIKMGNLDLLVGATFQQNINEQTALNASNYSNDALLGAISAAGTVIATDNYSLYKYSAIFGRINYAYNNRYIINLNARRDGSSRFGPGKQFGDFGSIAAGWIFSEEKFFNRIFPAISYGKLRGSYGTTGSDNIGNYQYLANWSIYSQSQAYQGIRGYFPQNLFNPDYSWALTKKMEAGIELGLFKDRILTNFTAFKNRSGNQLVSYPLANQSGFNNVTQNFPGIVENSGIEIQFTTINIKSKNITWTTSLNLTIPKNRLVSFPGLATSSYSNTYAVGQPLSVLLGYKYAGINDTTGVYQFLTAKGNVTYTPSSSTDYRVLGNLDPKYYGGLRNTFVFKGFQADIFLQFTKQLGLNYLGQIISNGPPGNVINEPTSVLNHWKKPGDVTEFEAYTTRYTGTPASTGATNYFVASSGKYSDASFIRVKTISVSYSFAGNYLKKMKLKGGRFYINAQNLFTITSYKGNDPETQSFYGLPPLKSVACGLQFTL